MSLFSIFERFDELILASSIVCAISMYTIGFGDVSPEGDAAKAFFWLARLSLLLSSFLLRFSFLQYLDHCQRWVDHSTLL